MKILTTVPAHTLQEMTEENRWLIKDLWTENAVGIIGGEPKCCKSFLALSVAISVASGTSCLQRYPVIQKGKVLLFAAEDALSIVRRRLGGIAGSVGLDLQDLEIEVITEPVLRLDREVDQERLRLTIEKLLPKLLILDPFVRLHRIDENSSGEVAPILANLRELQRRYNLSIIIVHHAKKGASGQRAGQALRGSSEFHAWGDVNLYMRRDGNESLNLTIEHRSAKSQKGIPLELVAEQEIVHLKIADEQNGVTLKNKLSTLEKVEEVFKEVEGPVPLALIRKKIGGRATTVNMVLKELVRLGQLEQVKGGYQSSKK
jgi:RecA-family ATPase